MRLAFCNATRRWGGVKTWTLEFADALRERGHTVVIYGRDELFLSRALGMGLTAVGVDFSFDYSPFVIHWFRREFRKRGTEAVLVNVGKDLRTAGVAARLEGLPLVQRIGLPGDMLDSLKVRLTHRLLHPRYLAPCAYIRDGMLRRLPFVREEDATVIHSAKRCLEAPPEAVSRPLRLVSASQVNANKGHAELAHTLALLRREGFAFVWEIAGVGDRLEDLRRLCAELGLDGSVVFHGFVRDIPALLRRCDVFLLASYTEGLPNSLLEAMANGLVPVARAVGGVAECWPEALPFGPVPYSGAEKGRDWFAPGAYAPADLPLHAPLRVALSASDESLRLWKGTALEHCRRHFSLPAQAVKLEAFFQRLIAASGRAT
jgi:glycosyltransferase involved in cell wall biosynthesis